MKIAVILCFLRLGCGDICVEKVCEFHFEIRRVRTMTYFKPDWSASYNVELDNKLLKLVPNSLRKNGNAINTRIMLQYV